MTATNPFGDLALAARLVAGSHGGRPMTADEFRAALNELGLSQTGFRALVEDLGGAPLGLRTVQHWVAGDRAVPPTVPVLLRLLRGKEFLRARARLRERETYEGQLVPQPTYRRS